MNSIGRIQKVVIDCPDPLALAQFYCKMLGMQVDETIHGWADDPGGWVVIGREPGMRELAFQRSIPWIPPRWPNPECPQQRHIDIRVTDADEAERVVLSLGGSRVPSRREGKFRVFLDPVGHPFCIVFGQGADEPGVDNPGP